MPPLTVCESARKDGRVFEDPPDAASSRGSRLAWYIDWYRTLLRSLPLRIIADDPVTGRLAPNSEAPVLSNHTAVEYAAHSHPIH